MASYLRKLIWMVLIAGCFHVRLAAQTPYIPDHVGTWTLPIDFQLGSRFYQLKPAEANAFEAKTVALVSLLQHARTFDPPMGFDVKGWARYIRARGCSDTPPCLGQPVTLEVRIFLYAYILGENGKVGREVEPGYEAYVTVNDPIHALGKTIWAEARPLPDGRNIQWEPRAIPLHVSGFQVYEGSSGSPKTIFLTKRDHLPWVPVTREQFLEASIRLEQTFLEKENAQREQDAAREAKREAQILASGNKSAIETLQNAKAANEAVRAKYLRALGGKEPRNPREVRMDTLRAELNGMTSDERASPAWYAPLRDGLNASGLVAPNAPNAGKLVTLNPEFLDRSRPRTDFQIICVEADSTYEVEKKKDDLLLYRLYEFLTTTDWQRVAALLD